MMPDADGRLFTKAINKDEVKENMDVSHNMVRTEVRSKTANSHLGHLFDDGHARCRRLALLHQLSGSSLCSEGRFRKRRIRGIRCFI